jgi:hypothetical protein
VGVWKVLGFVEGKGTTTEPQYYLFEDKNINTGTYSYRLKQIDFDGSFDYSNIVEVDIGMPNGFFLSQNYPNPFNPSTSIEYRVGSSEYVTLKVYDILGNEIATLVDEYRLAGSYEIEFNVAQLSRAELASLSSGVYFYQLKAGSFIRTKKMILLR